jgi:lipopolysaccharide biosynthesis regulator YciM
VHKDLTLRGDLSVTDKVAVLKQLALDYRDLNDSDMAEAALREMIALHPQDHWAHVNLLDLHKKAEKWDEAYDTAATILKLESNKSKKPLAVFKHHQGKQHYKKKDYHKARVLFKEAIGLDPFFVPAYLAIGDSYYEEKRFEDAVNFWNKLIAAVPDQGHLVIDRLKKTLFDLGRFGEIAEICERLLKHSPKNLEARLTLAEFFEKKGDLDTAEEILAQIVEDSPQDLKSIIELIRIYLDRGETRKINDLFRSLEQRRERLQNHPKNEQVDAGLIGIS